MTPQLRFPSRRSTPGLPGTLLAQDAIGNWLTPLGVSDFRGLADENVIELDMPSCIVRGEPLPVTVAVEQPTNATVVVQDTSSHRSWSQQVQIYPQPRIVEFGDLGDGAHRVAVHTTDPTKPVVSDVVYVSDPMLG